MVLAKNAKWFEENPEKRKKHLNAWYEKTVVIRKGKAHKYHIKNRDLINAKNRKYRQENRELTTRQWDECRKKRLKNNPQFKAKTALRCRLRDAFRAKGLKKSTSALKLLGCTLDFFKGYIERQFSKGMTWVNHGKVWHYDHIKPCAKFNLTDLEQQKECFHYTNIRPLLKGENQKKSAKELEEYQLKLM